MKNPKFTPDLLTPELKEAFIQQIEKYFCAGENGWDLLDLPKGKKED